MKTYQRFVLIFSAGLGLLAFQPPVQAAEADPAAKIRAGDVAIQLEGSQASVRYQRSKAQIPYSIYHAVWSEEGGQDDLRWYTASQDPLTSIDLNQHPGYGLFHIHTYIQIGDKLIALNSGRVRQDKPAGQTTAAVAGSSGQIAFIRNKEQTSAEIVHAVWSDENGQDDLSWYEAGQELTDFHLSQHRGYGRYFVDTYEKKNGQMIYQSGTTFDLAKPQPTVQTNFPEPGIMDIRVHNVPETIYQLTVPVWSENKKQDDLRWYPATKQPDGSYQVRAELRQHHFDTGTYHIHLYGESYVQPASTGLLGTAVELDAGKMPPKEEQKPAFVIEHINPEEGTYTVRTSETSKTKPIESVRVPIWSNPDHSNIKWYQADNHGDGSFSAQFDIRNHKLLTAAYNNHVYVKYKDGSEHSYDAGSVSMAVEQIKAKVAVYKISASRYQVKVTDAYGQGDIILPTWSEVNGQDDLKWYTAQKVGQGSYSFTVNAQNHTGSGLFHTHVYRQQNGQLTGLTGTTYQVEAEKIGLQSASFQPDYAAAAATTYPVGQCTWGAKALAPWAGNWWGNGGDWAASARRAGFQTGSTPQVGAIICWTDGGYGHVGVVTHVESETRIQIQESNYAGKLYIDNFRGWFNPLAAGQGTVSYIYPK